jgi:pilus assembly protein CpaE
MNIALISSKNSPFDTGYSKLVGHVVSHMEASLEEISTNTRGNRFDLVFFRGYPLDQRLLAQLTGFVAAFPTTAIIVVGSCASSDYLMELMRAGVREVIPNDSVGLLEDAIKRFSGRVVSSSSALKSQRIAFVSAKGGDGSSCVAANLATAIADLDPDRRTLAVDLSLPFGDLEMYLADAPAKHDLADFSDEVDRLDKALLESMVHSVSGNLDLIASPRAFEKVIHVVPESVSQLLDIATGSYQTQIIDLGSSIDPIGLQVIEKLDLLVIVATLTMPSLRRTGQLLRLCESLNFPLNKVLVVINKYSSKAALSEGDFESALGKKISRLLPQDSEAVQESLLKGVSVAVNTPKSPFVRELKDWASELTGVTTTESKSLWHRLGIK